MLKNLLILITFVFCSVIVFETKTNESLNTDYWYWHRSYELIKLYDINNKEAEQLANWICNYTKYFFNNKIEYCPKITALFANESSFKFKSGDGGKAYGIGMMHEYAFKITSKYLNLKNVKIQDLKNNKLGIHYTIAYLKILTDKYGSLDAAIGYYNSLNKNIQKKYKNKIKDILIKSEEVKYVKSRRS
ncbi:MAG: transglycosylase SLT domain-containing protein [Thermoplasmata archaeon]